MPPLLMTGRSGFESPPIDDLTPTPRSPTASTSFAIPPHPVYNNTGTTTLRLTQPLPRSHSSASISSHTSHDPWMLQRAHNLSPHTRTHTRATSETHSIFSFASDLPTRTSFRWAHLVVQFPLSLLALGGLAACLVIWSEDHQVRWVELGLGATAWLASEPIKEVVFQFFTWPTRDKTGLPIKGTGMGIPTVIHAIVQEFLRLAAILLSVALLPEPTTIPTSIPISPITIMEKLKMPQPPRRLPPPRRTPLPPLDTLFFSALWIALGWAIVEVAWGSLDFWRRMSLYDDVLDDDSLYDDDEVDRDSAVPLTEAAPLVGRPHRDYGSAESSDKMSRSVTMLEPAAEIITEAEEDAEDEAELDVLIRRVERLEVEAQLGVPLYEIPVMVMVIWRLDAIILSVVLTLFLSLPCRTTSPSLVPFPLFPTFIATAVTHVLLSLLWVLRIPYVGLPSLSYATLIIVVALLFAVLGAWGALE